MPSSSSKSIKAKSTPAKRQLQFDENDEDDEVVVIDSGGNNNNNNNNDNQGRNVTTSRRTTSDFFAPRIKKQKQQQLSTTSAPGTTDSFSVSASVVTPEKNSVGTPTKPKRTTETKVQKEKKKILTVDDENDDSTLYVPTYIHKNIEYQRLGQASIPSNIRTTFELIRTHYDIPHDFETNKRTFSPLSGTCYEERTIEAYNMGLFRPKKNTNKNNDSKVVPMVTICSECAAITDHTRMDCPKLI